MSSPTEVIDGYVAGTWIIDGVHSDVSFHARHLGIAKVRGHFAEFEGTIVTAENPLDSSVNAVIKTASVDTKNDGRNEHVRSADFLDAEKFPEMTFSSTAVRAKTPTEFELDGELTLHGVTKTVTLALELNAFGTGPQGSPAVGFSASTEISRSEFGVGGAGFAAVIGDKVKIMLEIEASQAPAA